MSNCITTYTGKHFDPTQPEKERICIDDIAHALSLLCRARGLPRRLALAALLHDASECYMSDVPRPFKKSLPEYQRQEEKLLCIIYEKYLGTGLSAKEKQHLKNIDNDLLWYDLKFLLNEEPPQPKPSVCVPIDYTVRPFQEVEDEYRMLFKQLRADIHNSDLLDHD